MKVDFYIADPAGNITAIVISPVPYKDRIRVGTSLIGIEQYGIEQVGFVSESRFNGNIRLEMMGGEFCGNALRSAGYLYGMLNGLKNVKTEISGADGVFCVECETDAGISHTEVPAPYKISQHQTISGAYVCQIEGIVHTIMPVGYPVMNRDEALLYLKNICREYKTSAAGIMFLDRDDRMTPVVYVEEGNTLFYESSCASGSAACACCMALGKSDGIYSKDLLQPGGTIETTVTVKSGRPYKIIIGGSIGISDIQTMEI